MVVKKKKPVMKEPTKLCELFRSFVSGPSQTSQPLVTDFLNATTLPLQLAILKQIVQKLVNETDKQGVVCGDLTAVLAALFYSAVPKHQIKKAISSASKNISPENKTELKRNLRALLTTQIDAASPMTVNNVAALLDNFILGEQCAVDNCIPIFKFLLQRLDLLHESLSVEASPVSQAAAMSECLYTVQIFTKLLHKSASTLSSPDILTSAVAFFVHAIQADNYLLDCKAACAMALTLIVKVVYKENAPGMLHSRIFHPDVRPSSAVDLESLSSCPPLSLTCLINGILAMLSATDLSFAFAHQRSLLVDAIAVRLISIMTDGPSETNARVIMAKTLVLWANKACDVADDPGCPSWLLASLHGNAPVSQQLIGYSWSHWEDPVDSLRHQARSLFDAVITCHLTASSQDPETSPFLLETTRSILALDWNSKGKYGPLCCLVDRIGTSQILLLCPEITERMFCVMHEQQLACYVSELYDKLLSNHCRQLSTDGTAKEAWLRQWVEPMLHKLCTGTASCVAHINEYIVPKFLKKNADSLPFVIARLSPKLDTEESVQSNLGALVTFLKQAKSLGILKFIQKNSSPDLWNGVVSMETIHLALCHSEDQIRLDALGLLCENLRTTEIISEVDFTLLLLSLPHNLRCQAPAFRQHLCALLKRFFVRFRESQVALKRSSDEENLRRYKEFHTSLCELLFAFLHPGASFPSRTATLAILSLMTAVLLDEDLEMLWSAPRVQTLLFCLGDTFEQNKVECYAILTALPTQSLKFSSDRIRDLVDLSFDLSKSTRPQDCNTAAYLLRLLARLPQSTPVIEDRVCRLNPVSSALESTQTSRCTQMKDDERSSKILTLLTCLAHELRGILAERSLLLVAAESPFYSVLHCMHYLLQDVSLLDISTPHLWAELLSELITMSFDVAAKVAPVVNHSSPEGNIPTDLEPLSDESETLSKVSAMPEYLIVCCWRSIKEVSLLLGFMCQAAPISREGRVGVITEAQVRSIGDYFIAQLLESRHRGAFELAYAGFVKMANMLWSCPVETLRSLPQKWLRGILSDIQAGDSKLCSTRRSAGVPFYVQALVTTEPSNTRRENFLWVMKELLCLAKPQSQCADDSQVHSMNILRCLFRDTRLSEDVSPFIAEGLQAAILGYAAQDWALRNSSSLLFSALMVRIFGVNRSRDETSKKNFLTGRIFFTRFPSLFEFLLDKISEATDQLSLTDCLLHLHPGLYPVLMVLGRLVPSPMEGPTSSVNLSAFIPHVIQCANSPVHKTRMMAARAICPLVAKDDIARVLATLFDGISRDAIMSHNRVHGILLQVDELMSELGSLPPSTQATISAYVADRLMQHRGLITKSNPCLPTQTIFLQVLTKTLLLESSFCQILGTDEIITYLSGVITHQPQIITHSPGRYDFMSAAADCVIAILDANSSVEPGIIPQFIKCDSYEVKIRVLRFISRKLTCETTDSIREFLVNSEDLFQELTNIALSDDENALCVAGVLEVFRLLPRCYQLPWRPNDKGCQVPNRLQTLQRHCRSEVSLSALRLSAQLMPVLLTTLTSTPCACHCLDQQVILADWCNTLSTSISAQKSLPLRLVCAQGLRTNANSLLTITSAGEPQFGIWRSLLRLLQDEDPEVRDVTAEVIASLPVQWLPPGSSHAVHSKIAVQPTVAMESCIVAMVTSCQPEMTLKLVETLCDWILTDLEPDWVNRDQEVRLFDKGELNTYRDELNLTASLVRHLDQLLQDSRVQPDLSDLLLSQGQRCRDLYDLLLPELKEFDLRATFLRDGDFNHLMVKLCRVQRLSNVLQRYDETLKTNTQCLNALLADLHLVLE